MNLHEIEALTNCTVITDDSIFLTALGEFVDVGSGSMLARWVYKHPQFMGKLLSRLSVVTCNEIVTQVANDSEEDREILQALSHSVVDTLPSGYSSQSDSLRDVTTDLLSKANDSTGLASDTLLDKGDSLRNARILRQVLDSAGSPGPDQQEEFKLNYNAGLNNESK